MSQPPQDEPYVALTSIPGLPSVKPVMTTASGARVPGFTAAGRDALGWWSRLRQAHPVTGMWPVLMDRHTPGYLAARCHQPAPVDLAQTTEPDGKAVLMARADRALDRYGPDLAAEIEAELRGGRRWPEDPRRPGFQLPFDHRGRPSDVTVALVPAQDGWRIPEVFGYGGWNDYPNPDEHAAILRYWHERYGADLVALTGTTAEIAVARPPGTRAEALALAWEYFVYNDGYYDNYGAGTITDLAGSLIGNPVWLAWWD